MGVCKANFNLSKECEDDAVETGVQLLDDIDSANKVSRFFETIGLAQQFELAAQKDDISSDDLTAIDDASEQKGLLEGLENQGLIEHDEAEMLRNGIFDDIDLESFSPEDLISIFGLNEDEVGSILSSYYANKQQRLAELQQAGMQEQLQALTQDIAGDEERSGTLQDIMTLLGVEKETPRGAQIAKRARGKYLLDNIFTDNKEFAEEPVNRKIQTIREQVRGNAAQEKNLEVLSGFYEQAYHQANGDGRAYQQGPRESVSIDYEPAGKSMSLIVKNLNETGLSFAVNTHEASNGYQTLVLTSKESEMTEAQIKELASFFFKGGLIKDPKDLTLPNELKVKGNASLNAQDIFNQAFAAQKQAQQASENDLEKDDAGKRKPSDKADTRQAQEQAPDNDTALSGGADNQQSGGAQDDYDKYLNSKELKPSYSKMRGAMEARAGIMGFRKNRLHWRRNLDGSMTLIAYLNEADERTDSELDKKGLQSRKKAFAVKVHKGPPPNAWLYIEPGKEIKSGHAKLILKAFQSQGCQYFTAGPTVELSGAGNSAFWKAAGSIPICPKLKRSKDDDGFDGFANDNLQEMLKVHKEEAKIDPAESLTWKMRLARELDGYTKFKRDSGKPDGKLETALEMLKGDIKFSKFTSSYQSVIESYIREQSRPDKDSRWTTADMASAVMASEELLYAIANGKDKNGKPFNYDYINQDPQKLIDFMVVKMAENRPTIDKLIDAQYEKDKRAPKDPEDEETQGSALERAANKILKNAKDNLNTFVEGDLVSNYGDAAKIRMNFPAAEPPTGETRYRNTPQYALDDNGNADHSPNNRRNQLYRQNRQARIPMPDKKHQFDY